ncbi:alkyl sulfatase C-terminal domain-containing protein [Nocardia jejuensis]
MPCDHCLGFAAVHVIGDRADDVDVRLNFTLTDTGEQWTL